MTTNGEIFDSNQMLGTSKTLPLPSIVRVTNLENGRTAIVRVNNRGPFVNNRMMDVSTTAARQLGMTGNTRVQVQIMAEQSLAVKNATLGTTSQLGIVRDEPAQTPVPVAATGPYTVQVGAFYSEDSAQQLASRIRHLGNVQIDNESGLHKVRVVGLDAPGARSTIDSLRSSEGLAPGLLMNGRWINADSI
ncbi:MAG: septal ring lytic transglycosylase RlpA family protein [Alphaproteobacteria bacterium]|nr:septal ring lytic transglycosylase RlpA family protein [Alphaproteobacteria bacterium]